ncbi:MAG: hypothetical protein Q8942_05635 [Bacillota bacterium]|nr:hypothetical protein [Bacillota bacterium]
MNNLSISIGYVHISSDDGLSIEDLMADADNLLIKRKKEKKKRRQGLINKE